MASSKTYRAKKKGLIHYLLIAFLLLPLFFFLLDPGGLSERPVILLSLLSPFAMLLWSYFDTRYTIVDGKLRYSSGFIRGEIDIATITEIIKGKTLWSGTKPALATKGLIVKFNRYDEVYIAPEDNEEVVADLLDINANIKVTAPGGQ